MGKLIIKMLENRHYPLDQDIRNLTNYISGKGRNGKNQKIAYIGANGASRESRDAAEQFIKVQQAYGKAERRRAYHMTVSFEAGFNDQDAAIRASKAIGEEIFKKYQVFYGVHASTDNLHTHFAINATSYLDGKKWHMSKPEFHEFKERLLGLANRAMKQSNLPPFTL